MILVFCIFSLLFYAIAVVLKEDYVQADCWDSQLPRSRYFLCCGRSNVSDGLAREDCWDQDVTIARGSKELCCNDDRIERLDAKVAAAYIAADPSPCSGADPAIWDYLQVASQRILWEGRLFSGNAFDDEGDELPLLEDTDATYEICVPALLLALMARGSRLLARRNWNAANVWIDAYQVWESLRWTDVLAWRNLQDPLVLQALTGVTLQFKVLIALVNRPEDACEKFINVMARILDQAKGLSLTVSENQAENIHIYPGASKTAMVLATYGEDLAGSASACEPARMCAHLFLARRFLDLRPSLAQQHLVAGRILSDKPGLRSAGPGNEVWAEILRRLSFGLAVHQQWLKDALWWVPNEEADGRKLPDLPSPDVGPSLATLMLWERSPDPVFSEGMKDPVLERLFGILGVTDRYYVEIGTQMGDQCNTRYLRARYGFFGLMIDDHWENSEINQVRHLVTPGNVVDLFQKYDVAFEFDMLSLDTDGYEWLLWLRLHQASYRPRVVVIEFQENFPFMKDVLVRYTEFPIHRLCLSTTGQLPRLAGGSMAAILQLGISFGYKLVHLITGGTTDMIFVRGDVIDNLGLEFPAQDNLAGLCALAAFQTGSQSSGQGSCSEVWQGKGSEPPDSLLATSADVLRGDYRVPAGWDRERLREMFCESKA